MNQEMTVNFPGGKKVFAGYNGFEIATDQDIESGGGGSAPEPFDLFLASLATCAGFYVLGFCQRRDLSVEGMKVTQTWERDPESRRVTTISISVETPPGFPVKYHKALERSIHQCAVKKTILDPPEFVVKTSAREES